MSEPLSEAEQAELNQWLASSDENKLLAKEIEGLSGDMSAIFAGLDPQTDTEWASLQASLSGAQPAVETEAVVRPLFKRPLFRVAAAAAIILLAVGTWRFLLPATEQGPAMQTILAENAATRQLDLEDGSQVHMNAGSSLRMEEGFGDKHRLLSLEGEAYFDVKTDPRHPFIIQANAATIEVIGTRFNVDARPGTDVVRLTVEEGKVRFGAKGNQLLVTAGEMAAFDSQTGKIRKLNGNVDRELAWRTGELVFENTPLKSAIAELESAYDIEIQAPASMLEGDVTARFKDENAQQAVEGLASLLVADVRWDGPRAILSVK